jgi:hypothetical protein
MYVDKRIASGTRTGTLTTDLVNQAAWGIDWFEYLTPTWMRNHEDENDLDVSLSLTVTSATALTAYGSSREMYTSAERGYDVTKTLASDATTTVTVPHYTFGDQVVYLSLLSTTSQTVTFSLANADQTRTVSSDVATTVDTCSALDSCSSHGSCVAKKCYCDDGYTGAKCDTAAFMGSDVSPANPRIVLDSYWPGVNSPFPENINITVPYEIRSAPPYSKVRIRVDGKPWPDRVGSVVHIGAAGTAASGNTYFSVNVMGLVTGVDHTVQIYLTAPSGKLLDAAEKKFQTKRIGGCAPDSNGNICTNHGLCFDGYCVCYDGYIGTDCSVVDSTTGTNLASGETGAASYTSPGSDFVATAAFKAFETMKTDSKISKTRTVSTMGLASTAAELGKITSDLKIKDLATQTAIEASIDSIAGTLTTAKLARDARIDTLRRKLDANAVAIQQDVLSAERGKAARLEEHINHMRSLYAHQTAVHNRLDAAKSATKSVLATKQATVKRHLAENEFTLNQVKLMNGPPIKIASLKKSTCTTDQFYGVQCTEETDAAAITDFVQAAPGTMDATTVLRG